MPIRIQGGNVLVQLPKCFYEKEHGLVGLAPHHLDLFPGGKGANRRDDPELPGVIGWRLALPLSGGELAQHHVELLDELLETKGLVGGTLDLLLEEGKVRGTQRIVYFSEEPAQDSRRRASDLAGHALHVKLGQAETEGIGGGGLHVMGFVYDHIAVFGQDLAAGGNIREQECVVDDQHMGGLGGLPGTVERTDAAHASQASIVGTIIIFR